MSSRVLLFRWVKARFERRAVRRSAAALTLAMIFGCAGAILTARSRAAWNQERLASATEELEWLTDGTPADDARRAAIAWGYSEQLRLGLESPFRLIEGAASDTRLTDDERRTVSWALLARLIQGQSHNVDAAVFDQVGPARNGTRVRGEQHLAVIDSAVTAADDPRAAELAVRLAYNLASTEGLVDGTAPLLAAEAAALIADGEIARREAIALVRGASGGEPIAAIHRRRAQRAFYVERPVLMAVDAHIERAAIDQVPALLAVLRTMTPSSDTAVPPPTDDAATRFRQDLGAAGALLPPASALAVTVQRYVPLVRARAATIDLDALRGSHNAEMLVAAITTADTSRRTRRAVGRLVLAAAVAQRSDAQATFAAVSDTVLTPTAVASDAGVASISFDRDVPFAWRPTLLRSFADGVRDLRRVLPTLSLAQVHVRFRMTPPADSALAMHDPRTRTLHLPAVTAGGTLVHEIAHELDRQSAVQAGMPGYRSDLAARTAVSGRVPATGRVAASLRALTEDVTNVRRISKATERPAEIFATQVDWFVAHALAREGRSNAFLSGVQDELLTGHVVHPDRLRSSGRSRSLLDALEAMTAVAAPARVAHDPTVETLLRWALNAPVDRSVAAAIVRGPSLPWSVSLSLSGRCDLDDRRALLLQIAAESRARGWLSQRARWIEPADRPAWAHALLHQAPWDSQAADRRVAELRDQVLAQLASNADLPAGLGAYAAATARRAQCD